jgi:hypothetical protein
MPSCTILGNSSVIVTVNNLTTTGARLLQSTSSTLNFNYLAASQAPTIASLSPISANPGIKGTINITGFNFGINSSDVTVFLSNATGKIYPLPILQINDTFIKAGLPGGQAGAFIVQVCISNGVGDSIPATNNSNVFTYVFAVTSVSPSTGSYNGGTLLTIIG